MPYFDKKMTQIIKGGGITLMFFHHFFSFPGWWTNGVYYKLFSSNDIFFRSLSGICVGIFCFITGFFYYYNQDKTFKYAIKKIIEVVLPYWLVFVFLGTISYLLGYNYTPVDAAKEMLLLSNTTMIFCWYVGFYIFIMLLFPIFVKLFQKSVLTNILLLIGTMFVSTFLFKAGRYFAFPIKLDAVVWIPVVVFGYQTAQYKLFPKLNLWLDKSICNKKIKIFVEVPLFIFLIIGVLFSRGIGLEVGFNSNVDMLHFEVSADCILVFLLIYAFVRLMEKSRIGLLNNILAEIGKKSMIMWYVHCVFFNQCAVVTQKYLYFLRNPVLVLAWGLLLCYVVSIPLQYISNKITKYVLSTLKLSE